MKRNSQLSLLASLVLLVAPLVIGSALNTRDISIDVPNTLNDVFMNVDSPNAICAAQDNKNACQGAFNCDNTFDSDMMECFFWVYDADCKALRPGNPWPGIRANQTLSFAGLDHDIVIQNVTSDLDETKIEAVWKFVDGYFGYGHDYTRGTCAGTSNHKCAYIRSSFTCK